MYKIYVSTFGNKIQHIYGSVPIEVGAYGRDSFVYGLRDDTGDNISEQNPYYGECTGLYWVWKNEIINDNDIVGFCHYNKSLLIRPEKVKKLLQYKYDFIVCRHQVISAMTIPDDYNTLVRILRDEYPQYYNAFVALYGNNGASNRCNAKNTFITTGKRFNEYCAVLFSVLERCREEIGDVEERKIKRYAALFAERLFSAYLYAEKLKFYEVDIKYNQLYMTVAKIIINRLSFLGDNFALKWLRQTFRKSPYKKMLKMHKNR